MTGDILDRLKAACVGHPHARIAWPHRLLHDAIEEIESLRKAVQTERSILVRDSKPEE